jgi:hypothetical protein
MPDRHTVLFVLLVLGVAAPVAADTPVAETPDAGAAATGDAPASTDAGKDAEPREGPKRKTLLQEADRIAGEIEAFRGLGPIRPIEKDIKDREQLRDILIEHFSEDRSSKAMTHEAEVFKKLGLIPKTLDYRELILDLYTEQIAGFYDERADQLNIMEGLPLALQRPTMAHELFHAIQDQHFGLTELIRPLDDAASAADLIAARMALVEGDAMAVMLDFSLYREGTLPKGDVQSFIDSPMMRTAFSHLRFDELGPVESMDETSPSNPFPSEDSQGAGPTAGLSDTVLARAPFVIQRSLTFPYLHGLRFVIALRRGRSWDAFNAVYDHPPVSTEQILHPERYAAGDEPVLLDYRARPVLRDWRRIYDAVLGEFQMRLFLKKHLVRDAGGAAEDKKIARRRIEEATKGWDGDRMRAFESDDGRVAITHLSAWDTKDDAWEYVEALLDSFRQRFPDLSIQRTTGDHGESHCMRLPARNDAPAERACVQRWNDLVLHVEGLPTRLDADGRETDPTTHMLTRQIWDTVDRKPLREVLSSARR